MTSEREVPEFLASARALAPRDIRIYVSVDGITAEALVVDEYELLDNSAIVLMLYHRVLGEIERQRERQARITEAVQVARSVTESTSGRHRVLNDENLAEAMRGPERPVVAPDDTQTWTVVEVNEPKQFEHEGYNEWMYRKARWVRWAAQEHPTFTGATVQEIEDWKEWSQRKDI